MKLKKLEKQDLSKVKALNKQVAKNLDNVDLFIPFKASALEELVNDGRGTLYGVFEEEKLAAVAGLLFDLEPFQADLNELSIDMMEIAEIGGCMTDASFRNKGYMYKLNTELIKLAKKEKLKYVLATAHPQNAASNKSLQNLGMQFVKEVSRANKRRNFYIMEL